MNDGLLTEWRKLYDERELATRALKLEITRLQMDLGEIETPYNDNLAILEAEIKAAAVAIGCGHKAAGVEVSYRKGYERASWDDKWLNGYAASHPEILPARKVTAVAASVSVKAL